MHFSLASVLLALAVTVSAAPADLERRAAATCGSQYYSAAQVNAASVAACNYFRSGSTAGSSSYPHRYNNYEGFYFQGLDGPYQEFPILPSGLYTGGSPGADRVIITEASCRQAGTITHTGASGNNFVACSGTS
ncbi:Ribonuclease/ribotoxin [Emericellopsis atlantica]|uniref:ribonuclease T1 n=1 Tax=Emericellopsis atlantica TaxID=2614577 RepID=A0A9P7ZI14_9HYPO|nr:Ribonuclease/ribotoxin [Emericellopsis atlantica]KAG9251868.1 Ribonuclease/ribotoxin [Emericellopsis atlantica]